MAITYNTPFMQKPDAGFRLGDIRAIWDAIVNNNANSSAYGIAAAGTTQATATQLTSVINAVDTVTSSTGVNLPNTTGNRATPFQFCYVINNGANTLAVYAAQGTSDTINGTAGATGITLATGVNELFVSAQNGKWESFGAGDNANFGALSATTLTVSGTSTLANVATTTIAPTGSITFGTVNAGIVQKQGTNGKVGTFAANGTNSVTVTNTSIATSDAIIISLNTVGGTVGAQPHLATITAGTGFTVVASVSDTSTYNYSIISSAS